ncbi:MAG: sialate O-acetylesterase [Planctomycetota bacterium]
MPCTVVRFLYHPPLILMLVACGTTQATDIDVVLLAGQSNSVGRATPLVGLGGAVPGATLFDSRVQYYYDVDNTVGAFPADSGQTFGPLTKWFNTDANRSELGHEFGLARSLVAGRDTDVAVIKFAVGGSSISRWQPGQPDHEGLLEAVNDGIQELIDGGCHVNVLGLAWHQGESDANAANAGLYAGRLNTLISSVRSNLHTSFPTLGFDELKVALVEPAQSRPANDETLGRLNTVDSALQAFAASDPHAEFIETSDLAGFVDTVHFNSISQQTIGQRIANALGGVAQPEKPKTFFVQPDSISADTTFNGNFSASNLIGQLDSEESAVDSLAPSSGGAYASSLSANGTAALTLDFDTPQDVTDFVFWNYRNGSVSGARDNGTDRFTLELYDGRGGAGNLLGTYTSTVALAPQTGDTPAQVYDLGGVAEGVVSAVLTLTDTDNSSFVGAHEIGFLAVPEPDSLALLVTLAATLLAPRR